MAKENKGILAVVFDFSTAHEDEFHDWYDLEHLPEREAIPGFEACERWSSVDDPTVAVATYDLASIDVFGTEAYKSVAYDNLSVWSKRVTTMSRNVLRHEGTQVSPGDAPSPAQAGGLLITATNVPPEQEEDFNAWFEQEHLAALSDVDGCLLIRRFHGGPGSQAADQYVTTYHLSSPDVVQSKAWLDATQTPWGERVQAYSQNYLRVVAARYQRRGS